MHHATAGAEVAQLAAVRVEVLLVALEQRRADGDLGSIVILEVRQPQIAREAVLAGIDLLGERICRQKVS